MTPEKLEQGKELYLKNIKRYIAAEGSLFPHFVVFGERKTKSETEEDPDFALIHIPIPDEYMENNETKDKFVEDVIPEIAKEVTKKYTCEAVGFAAEAWIRVANSDKELPNWKELPIKKEVVFINIESKDNTLFRVYNINRLGKQVNENGDLTDHVELEEDAVLSTMDGSSVTGRMSGLYKKFTEE